MTKAVLVNATFCLACLLAVAKGGEKGLRVGGIKPPAGQVAPLVQVDVDQKSRIYELGEEFKVTVTAGVDGHLYLLYVHSDDSVYVLFPNGYLKNNSIEAGQSLRIPRLSPPGSPDGVNDFRVWASKPLGQGKFKALITSEKLNSIDVSNLTAEDSNCMLELQLEDIVEIQNELTKGAGVRFGAGLGQQKQRPQVLAEHELSIKTVEKGVFGKGKRAGREQRRFVFAVGVGEQQAKGLADFPACAADARVFARLMKEQFGADQSQVLVNRDVTVANVCRQLQALANKVQEGDEVILYWSGHGGRVQDDAGDESDSMDEYLVTWESDLSTEGEKRTTTLTDDLLGRLMQDFSHCEVLVIFDTCYSGGFANNEKGVPAKNEEDEFNADDFAKGVPGGPSPAATGQPDSWESEFNVFAKDIKQRTAMVISSSRAVQKSYVRRDHEHSVMTYFLLKYLREHTRKSFSPQEMFHAISAPVSGYVAEMKRIQTPVLIGKDKSEIRF